MNVRIDKSWNEQLASQWEMPYFKSLANFVRQRYAQTTVYPPAGKIFAAFDACPFDKVKVVILGQDPYHGPNQAHCLSFSVRKGIAPPPSLVNIFKEIQEDSGINNLGKHGDLTQWAKNGGLLLNTVLTVRAGLANSHRGMGWEQLTDTVIDRLNEREKPVVFLLWGANAKAKRERITAPQHLVLTAAHPSPLSAHNGFFGCRHFSKANAFLTEHGIPPVDWRIDPD